MFDRALIITFLFLDSGKYLEKKDHVDLYAATQCKRL